MAEHTVDRKFVWINPGTVYGYPGKWFYSLGRRDTKRVGPFDTWREAMDALVEDAGKRYDRGEFDG